jgi:AcrR family transcriptional regulator
MSAIAEKPDKEKRRREILDAAFQEFSTKGYGGASMEAIARRARASKETLYAWFENKEALLNTLFASRLEGMVSRVVAAAQKDPSPANVLPIIAEDTIRFMLAIAPLTDAMGPGEPGDKASRLLGQTISEERKKFVDYILQCRAQGHIAFDDDPFEIVSLFVAMAQGEWSMRLSTGMLDKLTAKMIEDHAQRVTRLFLKGLAPEGSPAVGPYSAAEGNAFVHSSGSSSSLRFGKKSAQASVMTEKTDSTAVTAATLPVRSYNVDTTGAAAAAPRKPTKKRTE